MNAPRQEPTTASVVETLLLVFFYAALVAGYFILGALIR